MFAGFILFVDLPRGFINTCASELRDWRVVVLKNLGGFSTPDL